MRHEREYASYYSGLSIKESILVTTLGEDALVNEETERLSNPGGKALLENQQ